MQKMTTLALAMTVTAVAVPAAAYYWPRSGDDPLGDTLRGYGLAPITPPTNLMSVGSLYYVDAGVKDFRPICHAEKADLEGAVKTSRSWEMQQELERKGRFATDVKIDFGWLFKGDVDNNYVQKVHFSLTDVVIEEIPLGTNWLIFAKLMEKAECNKVAMQYINGGGYVCQGQKILQATAEFKLDRDVQNKLATSAKVTADEVKDLVKRAIETQSDQSVVEQSGRLFSGSALKYGVSMNPICMAPPNGRFERVLPRTVLGRILNFVLFAILEPILPAKEDRPEVAQVVHATAGREN
jgi:hypothetical protein